MKKPTKLTLATKTQPRIVGLDQLRVVIGGGGDTRSYVAGNYFASSNNSN